VEYSGSTLHKLNNFSLVQINLQIRKKLKNILAGILKRFYIRIRRLEKYFNHPRTLE